MNPCFNEYLQNQNVIDKDVNTIGSCLLDSNTEKVCYKNFTDNISKLSKDTDFSNVIQRYKSCIIANNSPTPTPPSETSSSNIGMIIGIIFGVLILFVLSIWYLRCRDPYDTSSLTYFIRSLNGCPKKNTNQVREVEISKQ